MLYDNLRAEEREWELRGKKQGEKIGEKVGEKRGRQIGIRETIVKMIKNMLECGEMEEKIKKYTGANQEEIEEVKKTLIAK